MKKFNILGYFPMSNEILVSGENLYDTIEINKFCELAGIKYLSSLLDVIEKYKEDLEYEYISIYVDDAGTLYAKY